MKFVVTGAAGHVSKPLTILLLKKEHDVTVVGRNPKNLGLLFEDIQKTKPKIEGTRIEDFAKTWAAAYR